MSNYINATHGGTSPAQGYAAIGLDNPKNSINVGHALRACGVYGARMLATSNQRYKRAPTDTMAAWKNIPLLTTDDLHSLLPFDCVPIAVDIVAGAIPLSDYVHPARAFYIFGAEDNTLGSRILSWCRDTVYIPTMGCMNLAATVNVVLYDRGVKRGFVTSHLPAAEGK